MYCHCCGRIKLTFGHENERITKTSRSRNIILHNLQLQQLAIHWSPVFVLNL